MHKLLTEIGLVIGIERNTTNHLEKFLSGLGGFISISLCYVIAKFYLDGPASVFIVTSVGASAVLIFAVPHGTLSQPWSVIGGHLISATIGVFCQQHIPNTEISAAAAVGGAIFAMYYLRCLHPPGGATALFAVIGGSSVSDLGFSYVIYPVFTNAVALVIFGILFNALFHWRRYPGHLFSRRQHCAVNSRGFTPSLTLANIATEDFAAALHEMNSFIDVSPEDLSDLFELASRSAINRSQQRLRIKAGLCYSNAARGSEWAVREVLTVDGNNLKYRIAAGTGNGSSDKINACSKRVFKQWARCQVITSSGLWIPCQPGVGNKP
ncbi:Uncharacterised protein [Zhongshania aliphaticivorans]|uniref:HPP transmembrane region domain-containing protein n=1 Tax=Zhongshania aliphaticivorans TaxID=1470434 RepID=A0A5S9N7B4_9GAMM|nr:HPP family protein [Zhongshania aliphaticivorans]CAA0080210.1 Uncharacterised protein [Zhongshania aliphaticivorans]CAA0085828.1 Uncharacterised protein [Zhongshania aliphaticivorans]